MEKKPPEWAMSTRQEIPAPSPNGLEILPYLVVLHGGELGRRILVKGESLTIGRGEKADIRIHDERISGIHCRVRMTREGLLVEDLKSSNGTFIDEQRITKATLLPHCQLRVGRTVMRVEFRTEAEIKYQEDLFVAATTDPLTRVPNRRWFSERAEAEVAFANRSESPLCVVMLDVDHFKKINDTYGHQAGDAVLVRLAAFLMEKKRQEDLLCRFGGEEFLFLVRWISLQSATVFCERTRIGVMQHAFKSGDKVIPVTVSMGISCFRKGDTLESMIGRADRALYQAKQQGRNRVQVEEGTAGGPSSGSTYATVH